MITVVLHGFLGQKYGKKFTLSVNSAAEAIAALSQLYPGFRKDFIESEYVVQDSRNYSLDENEIHANFTGTEINFYPVLSGAKSQKQKSTGKIVLSAVLFFAAPYAAPWLAASSTFGSLLPAASTMISAANSVASFMLLGGISGLLTPEAKSAEAKESFQIGSPEVATGQAVPLCYGRGYFDVIPISAEISSASVGGYTNNNPLLPPSGGGIVDGGRDWTDRTYTEATIS